MTNVLLLGDPRVGKSSFLRRLTTQSFTDTYMCTIGKTYSKYKNITVHDTAGYERFHTLIEPYYVFADGAIILYDITSTCNVNYWKHRVLNISRQNIPILVVGNKIDLTSGYEKIDGAKYISCKTGENVTQIMDEFISTLQPSPRISIHVKDRFLALFSTCVQQ